MNGYRIACEYTMSILKHARVHDRAVPITDVVRRFGAEIVEERIWPRRAMVDLRRRRIILHPMDASVQSWYIAHEFGHILLPPEYGEHSCDTFAYCLLMPHEWLTRDLAHTHSQTIANWYGVTPAILKRRLRIFWNSDRTLFEMPASSTIQ